MCTRLYTQRHIYICYAILHVTIYTILCYIILPVCYTGNDIYGNRIYARGTWRIYTVICALPVYICVHTNITILYYVIQVMMYTVIAYMLAGPGAHTLLYVPYLYLGKMCNPRLKLGEIKAYICCVYTMLYCVCTTDAHICSIHCKYTMLHLDVIYTTSYTSYTFIPINRYPPYHSLPLPYIPYIYIYTYIPIYPYTYIYTAPYYYPTYSHNPTYIHIHTCIPTYIYPYIHIHTYSTLLLSYLFIPESPRYLVLKARYTLASYELNILCNIHSVTPTVLYDIYTPTIPPVINTTDNTTNNSSSNNIIHTLPSSSTSAVPHSASYRYSNSTSVDLWRYPCRWCSSVRSSLGQLMLDPELRSITLVLAAIW